MRDSIIVNSNSAVVGASLRVLRNTYLLLAATLMFSAGTAGIAYAINMPPMNIWLFVGGQFLFLFLVHKFSDRASGILWVFALTGFLGLSLGGIINVYLARYSNGGQLVATSLLYTALIFLALSFYVVVSKKDFSFLGGMLSVGILTGFGLSILASVFNWPAVSLAVSAAFILLSSGLILYQTSRIINGGETNYILATITLYAALYNLFMSLLHLLTAFGGDE